MMRFHVLTIISGSICCALPLSYFVHTASYLVKAEKIDSCDSSSMDRVSSSQEEDGYVTFGTNDDYASSEKETNHEEEEPIFSQLLESEDETNEVNDDSSAFDDGSQEVSGDFDGYNDEGSEEESRDLGLPHFVQDKDERCAGWVEDGFCLEDPHYMLRECLRSCLETERVLELAFFSTDSLDDECYDLVDEDDCNRWAEDGYCYDDDEYMMKNCPNSCYKCIADGSGPFKMGESQIVNDFTILDGTINVMLESIDYMTKVVMQEEKYIAIRRRCFNKNKLCSHWAAKGLCTTPDDIDWMQVNCAPACGTCEMVDMRIRCPIPDGVEPILKKSGDLNRIFERIIGEADFESLEMNNQKFNAKVLSRPYHPPAKQFSSSHDVEEEQNYVIGPWVITIDDFLTPSECDRLIVLGYEERYELSTEVTALPDGTDITGDKTKSRTSTNAWCKTSCYKDPVAQRIIEKLSNLTGIPEENSEFLQLLKYEPGQFYKSHHDYLRNEKFHPSGPRTLTVFLYLNDVKEGGGTRFNDLGGNGDGTGDIPPLDVEPKRGMALLWPSVLDEDPLKKDLRTFHEALMVTKGFKYGANAWFHLRDNRNLHCS